MNAVESSIKPSITSFTPSSCMTDVLDDSKITVPELSSNAIPSNGFSVPTGSINILCLLTPVPFNSIVPFSSLIVSGTFIVFIVPPAPSQLPL